MEFLDAGLGALDVAFLQRPEMRCVARSISPMTRSTAAFQGVAAILTGVVALSHGDREADELGALDQPVLEQRQQ